MSETNQSVEIHESQLTEELTAIAEQLTVDQMRFVQARQEHNTDKAAAESLEISPDTIKSWKRKGYPIDRACELMAQDGLIFAASVRRKNLLKAMLVKVAGLDSDDERLRQAVSTEIVEWEMGKATQTQRHEGTGEGGAIVVQNVELTDAERRDALKGMFGLSADAHRPDADRDDQP